MILIGVSSKIQEVIRLLGESSLLHFAEDEKQALEDLLRLESK
jgi:hypothetical protein